ncbi:unnamed protein product [Heligmosomoides polygyrus]|uniref:Secreted protein n=1 Tax=Heligmosomoides polygyrus TaxID=6339 RepID=A0A183GM05_HELPZ|nr:unnamed protein product [Heligmosomoides polygyrus]
MFGALSSDGQAALWVLPPSFAGCVSEDQFPLRSLIQISHFIGPAASVTNAERERNQGSESGPTMKQDAYVASVGGRTNANTLASLPFEPNVIWLGL